ncbi:MAG: hypothetical protein ABW123_29000 [Cystobacter sp.]
MNRFLGPASLAVSLLALAVAFWSPRKDETPAPSPTSTSAPAAASPSREVKDLELRVKMLEDNAVNLSRRLMQLEQRPGGTGAGTAGGPVASSELAAEVERLRADVRGLSTGQPLQSEGGREYFKGMLRSVQEEMRNEQREQRQDRMLQNMVQSQAQQSERVRRFATEARLNSSQERDVMRHLESESNRRQELLAAVQNGGEPRNMRQELRQLREQTDTQVKALLDASQQAQYEQMRREERRGGDGRPSRGGMQREAGDTR